MQASWGELFQVSTNMDTGKIMTEFKACPICENSHLICKPGQKPGETTALVLLNGHDAPIKMPSK